MSKDREARDVALQQGGVVLRGQALDLGFTSAQIKYRLRKGEWTPVAEGAYRVLSLDGPLNLLRSAATVLPGAVVSHESAAEVHGLPLVPRGRVVVTVHSSTTHDLEGVTVHRTRDMVDEHVAIKAELCVTTVARTLVDLGSVYRFDRLNRIVDACLAGRHVSIEALVATFGQVGRRGKKGTASMRRILEDRLGESLPEASALELLGMGLLERSALPLPIPEYAIPWSPGERFDAAFPDCRVAIEWDSRRWHGRFDDFDRDRRRDRNAALHGWIVLRFSWEDVVRHPAEVVSTVRAILEERSRCSQ